MSRIFDLATSLVDVLKAIPGCEDTIFDASPELEMRAMRSLKIIVCPESYTPVRVAAGVTLADAVFSVAIIQSNKDVEAMLSLEERIADGLQDASIGTKAKVTTVEFSPPYDAERLRKEAVFFGILMVSVKEISR